MSYVSSYHHCVFSTKDRRPIITSALQERLWPYLGGIARENKMTAIEIGGVEDHVHMLLSLPSTLIRKGVMHPFGRPALNQLERLGNGHQRLLGWQVKYGSFSVSASQLDKIIAYIKGQAEHHRKMT